jgi:FMN-dependent NADH-azoreductase
MKPFKFLTNNDVYVINLPMVSREVILRNLYDGPTPSNPSYYNVSPDFMCVGVTPRRTNPDTYEPYRHLVYEDIHTGRMTQADVINTEHPMYNFYREIEPEFYNSHYVDRR